MNHIGSEETCSPHKEGLQIKGGGVLGWPHTPGGITGDSYGLHFTNSQCPENNFSILRERCTSLVAKYAIFVLLVYLKS